MTNEQEKTLVDVLCWNVYVFRTLLGIARKSNGTWAEIADSCIQQNIAMVQALLPHQPLSALTEVERKLIPPRRLMQIEALERLFADSPNE